MLPDRSILIGQKLVENVKIENETFLVIFKHCEMQGVSLLMPPRPPNTSSRFSFACFGNLKNQEMFNDDDHHYFEFYVNCLDFDCN